MRSLYFMHHQFGCKNEVSFEGLMAYSPFKRPFSVSAISLHNSSPTLQEN